MMSGWKTLQEDESWMLRKSWRRASKYGIFHIWDISQFNCKDTKFTGHRGLTWSGRRSCKCAERKIRYLTLSEKHYVQKKKPSFIVKSVVLLSKWIKSHLSAGFCRGWWIEQEAQADAHLIHHLIPSVLYHKWVKSEIQKYTSISNKFQSRSVRGLAKHIVSDSFIMYIIMNSTNVLISCD